jgi:hypothetical protein
MTFRKRRNPTPGFKLPPPYEPLEGIRAPLKTEGVFPYCAMFQVAAEDTHDNYVICRGFDVRIAKFIDYAAGDANKPGIAVAKPFGARGKNTYEIGQIFAAALPLQSSNPSPTSVDWRVGQNPGVSETTTGHPANLAEKVDELKTDEEKYINWMFIESPSNELYWGMLMEDHPGEIGVCFKIILADWNSSTNGWDFDCDTPEEDWETAIDYYEGVPYPGQYTMGHFERRASDTTASGYIYVVVDLSCESHGSCESLEGTNCGGG